MEENNIELYRGRDKKDPCDRQSVRHTPKRWQSMS